MQWKFIFPTAARWSVKELFRKVLGKARFNNEVVNSFCVNWKLTYVFNKNDDLADIDAIYMQIMFDMEIVEALKNME